MNRYKKCFTNALALIEKDAELKETMSPSFIKEIKTALQLVEGTHAEIEIFTALPEKTQDELKEKVTSLKETGAKAKPVKVKIQRHLKKLGKDKEAADVMNDE